MAQSTRALLKQVAVLRSRELRKALTPAERRLWEALRARRFRDLKFRRQHPIMHDLDGPGSFYIVDFFCHRFNLIIEVDGGYHSQNEDADSWRGFQLSQLGYHTLRFSNEQVLTDIEQVLAEIGAFLECPINRQPPPL